MKNNINALNDAWISAGQKVTDLQDKKNQMAIELSGNPEKYTDEEITKVTDGLVAATKARDFAKSALDEARQADNVENLDDKDKKPLNKGEKNLKDKFVADFKAMMKGDRSVLDIVTSDDDPTGSSAFGLTIPDDVETVIHTLVRQYDSLQQYVNVEKVTTSHGSRVYEKWTDVTALSDLDDENGEIADNDDPHLSLVKYLIHRYAGITTITDSLLKDTADNIIEWLSQWIAKKVVVTRNLKIIGAMNAVPKKPTVSKFDDVITMINTAVDPAIKATSIIMTNESGFNALSLVKDGIGRSLLERDPTQPDQYLIKGKRVIEIADRWLPNNGASMPLYYGDLKQAVTLFDRENMSLLTTNIGDGAFKRDQTKLRVIDRFDVEATDTEAFVAGSFTKIANEPLNVVTAQAQTPAASTNTDAGK